MYETNKYTDCVQCEPFVLTGSVLLRKARMSKLYRFADDEKLLLETVFAYNPYPTRTTRKELAEKLAVNETKVCNWFIRKRSLLNQETTQARLPQRKYSVPCFVHINTYTAVQHTHVIQ